MLQKLTEILRVAALSLMGFASLSGQQNINTFEFIPRTPEAARLIENIEVPVSTYTGTAQITVPLWSYSHLGLSQQASLSYRTGGVRVDQVASNVGLGWTLQAEPMITRKINGLPDEVGYIGSSGLLGFLGFRDQVSYADILALNTGPYDTNSALYDELANGCSDSEPDEYFFNIGEASGTFMFDWTGYNPIVISEADVKVIRMNQAATEWKIISQLGNEYIFRRSDAETTVTVGSSNPIGCSSQRSNAPFVTSWHCTTAKDVNGETTLTYQYMSYAYTTDQRQNFVSTQAIALGPNDEDGCAKCQNDVFGRVRSGGFTTIVVDGRYLKRISASTGEYLHVNYKISDRSDTADFQSHSNFRAVDNFEIGRGSYLYKTCSLSYLNVRDRLFLHEVAERGKDESAKPPYSFKYVNPGDFPTMYSNAIDQWGFYNGATSNSHLIAEDIGYFAFSANPFIVEGVNRDLGPNLLAATGSLYAFTNPLGGETEFVYEANRYSAIMNRSVADLRESEIEKFRTAIKASGTATDILNTKAVSFSLSSDADVTFEVSGIATFECFPTLSKANLKDQNGSIVKTLQLTNDPAGTSSAQGASALVSLKSGTYTLEAVGHYCDNQLPAPNNDFIEARVMYCDVTESPVLEKPTGGLRIAEKHVFDPVGNNTISTVYKYTDTTGLSSGIVYAEPRFKYQTSTAWWDRGQNQGPCFAAGKCSVLERVGSSRYQLAQTKGSHIGYGRVEEWQGRGKENGYSVVEYTTPRNFPDIVNTVSPFAPPSSQSHKTGYVTSMSLFDHQGEIIQFVDYEYKDFDKEVPRVKVGYSFNLQLEAELYGAPLWNLISVFTPRDVYTVWTPPYRAGYRKPSKITTTQIFGTKAFETTESFTYDDKLRKLRRRMVNTGTADERVYELEYAEDLVDNCLMDRNMLALPLVSVQLDAQGNIVRGQKLTYAAFTNGQPQNGAGCDTTAALLLNKAYSWNGQWTEELNITRVNAQNLPTSIQQREMNLPQTLTYDDNRISSHTITDASVSPAEVHTQRWTYKGDSKLIESTTAADGQVINYFYDGLSRLKKVTQRNGNVTTDIDYYFSRLPGQSHNYRSVTNSFGSEPTGLSSLSSNVVKEYFDGLGRPYQTVQQQHHLENGTYLDVATARDYDNFGRLILQYEPLLSAYSDGRPIDFTGQPATETQYFAEPLNRPRRTISPETWLTTDYSYAAIASGELLNPFTGNSFPAGSLLLTTTTDGNQRKMLEYKDRLGRVVASGYPDHLTFHKYDLRDRPTDILPPDIAANSPERYRFEYDLDDNMTLRKIPSKGEERMVYDDRNRIIFSSDANLRSGTEHWIANTYDSFNRPLYSGLVKITSPQPTTNPATYINAGNRLSTTRYGRTGIEIGRPVRSTSRILEGGGLAGELIMNYKYDAYGRLEFTKGNHILNLADTTAESSAVAYDFVDNALRSTYAQLVDGTPLTTVSETEIGPRGRLLKEFHQVIYDGTPQERTLTAAYDYTPKDEIDRKRMGGTSGNGFLQVIDYTYLQNGFLTAINDPDQLGNNLFSLGLNYRNPAAGSGGTAQRNGNISSLTHRTATGTHFVQGFAYDGENRLLTANYRDPINTANHGRYTTDYSYDKRGNITNLTRNGKKNPDVAAPEFGLIDDLTYGYVPGTDRLSQISDAAPTGLRESGFTSKSNSNYGYDLNGNMVYDPARDMTVAYNYLNLPYRFILDNGEETLITYTADGSKLLERKLADDSALAEERAYVGSTQYLNGTLDFVSHPNGRVKYKSDSGCLPTVVVDQPQTANVLYQGVTIEASSPIYNNTDVTFEAGQEIMLLPGFSVATGSNFKALIKPCTTGSPWQYEYFLTDHLGNVRVTFADVDRSGVVDTSEVLSEHHYYAFGLEMGGDWNGDEGQRYRYNGKELNEDLGLYDYGARWYDPAIARWNAVDPLASDYASMSPYNYVTNNPIVFIDPDGMRIDVSSLLRKNEDGSRNYEGFATLVIMLRDLSDLTGTNVSYSGGELVMGGSNGSDDFSSIARDRLSTMISDERTIEVSASGESASHGESDGNINMNPYQSFGTAIASEEAGLDQRTYSIGMQFLHETLHTNVGAEAAGAEKSGWFRDASSDFTHKWDILGNRADVTQGAAIESMNLIRSQLGLRSRLNHSTSVSVPSINFAASGQTSKGVRKTAIDGKIKHFQALFKSFYRK